MRITLCASFSFYEHLVQVGDELLTLGHTPFIPESAKVLKLANNYTRDPFISSSGAVDTAQKTKAIRRHFDEINRADAILVINDEKHGQANYIGPNVLMEMAVAFALHKPIYLFGDMPRSSPLLDEIRGLKPITLKTELGRLGQSET